MRLLDTTTLKLKEFVSDPPKYAILSHTWEDDEVLFSDFQQGTEHLKRGYEKVKNFCRITRDQYQYGWVDSCCIDKSSSAELSEAINSMFVWYRNAEVCFVYLNIKTAAAELSTEELRYARWTLRGWTLQELIAPGEVKFFNRNWELCGDRLGLAPQLQQATNIDVDLLSRTPGIPLSLERYSIARRMSWASDRQTTRSEDLAYCLLGLFDVHMPLLYGEGGHRAFIRLQEEIVKRSTDLSILAWDAVNGSYYGEPLARTPARFSGCTKIVTMKSSAQPFENTNKGLRITLPIIKVPGPLGFRVCAVLHNCRYKDDFRGPLGILLTPLESSDVYYRDSAPVQVVDLDSYTKQATRTIYITQQPHLRNRSQPFGHQTFPIWFKAYLKRLHAPLRERIFIRGPLGRMWDSDTCVLRQDEAWPEFGEPVYVDICFKVNEEDPFLRGYNNDGRADPIFRVRVSPLDSTGASIPQVGLSKDLSNHKDVCFNQSATTEIDNLAFKASSRLEKKKIMDEVVLEVTIDFWSIFPRDNKTTATDPGKASWLKRLR